MASSWAINDFIKLGKNGKWSVHAIEHQLSAYYDITHGIGLAILTPHWMEYILNDQTVHKFSEFGIRVWNIEPTKDEYEIAREAIQKTKNYFVAMGIPQSLHEIGIKDDSYFDEMAEKASLKLTNAYVPLTKEDVKAIYYKSL